MGNHGVQQILSVADIIAIVGRWNDYLFTNHYIRGKMHNPGKMSFTKNAVQ